VLNILGRVGRITLTQLHVLLHRHGVAVDSAHPVKALADALGYETDIGNTQRVARGTYELMPGVVPPRRLWRGGPPLPPLMG
jgi:hypothetical protein